MKLTINSWWTQSEYFITTKHHFHVTSQKLSAVWMRRFACACFRLWWLAESSWTSCVRRPLRCNLIFRARSASSPPSVSAQSCTACWSSTWRGRPALSPSSVGENHERKIFSQITCTERKREKELTKSWPSARPNGRLQDNRKQPLWAWPAGLISWPWLQSSVIFLFHVVWRGQEQEICSSAWPDLASWTTQSPYCSEWQEGQ